MQVGISSCHRVPRFMLFLAVLTAVLFCALPASASFYRQTNLVSDIPGIANNLDPNLVNPWGIALSPTSPFWVSDNGTGMSTLYNGDGVPQSLVVTIPPPPGGAPPAAPTGIVFNNTGGAFPVLGEPAVFIFATEDGTIAGWNPSLGPNAALAVYQPDAIYKGLAIASTPGGPRLYATDFHNALVETWDPDWNQILFGAFQDPNIPAGFAPFGIANIQGHLLVTYAKQDSTGEDDVPGPGFGYVDVFDYDGGLQQRLISQGVLNSPWGLALAPADFGDFSNDLLVGNFGDGKIHAFDPPTGAFIGTLADSTGADIVNEGLWGLTFGNGTAGGQTNFLYFSAGIPGAGQVEDHGLFGSLRFVEAPTPVFLTTFEGEANEDGVLLRWTTPADAGSLTFDVYRDAGAGWLRINAEPVRGSGSSYTFRDPSASPGAGYDYGIAVTGEAEVYGRIHVNVPPGRLALRVAPCPATAGATASLWLPATGDARLSVFDVTGREVVVLTSGSLSAGAHHVAWTGGDMSGRPLPGGIYFIRARTSFGVRTAPITLVR